MQGLRKYAGDATQLQLACHHDKRTVNKGHVARCGHHSPRLLGQASPKVSVLEALC